MKNIDKQIFDRQSFIDLAKAAKLNVEHIRQLSDAGNHEIVVGGKLLDMLIEVQNQFERLEAMGDRYLFQSYRLKFVLIFRNKYCRA